MNFLNLAAGGAAISAIVAFWSKIKAVAWRILSLFIERSNTWSIESNTILISYLREEYKYSKAYDKMYTAHYVTFADGRYGLVSSEFFGRKSMIFWNGIFPAIFTYHPEVNSANGSSGNTGTDRVYSSITFLRGTFNLDKIFKEAIHNYNNIAWNSGRGEGTSRRFFIKHVPEIDKSGSDSSSPSSGNTGVPWYMSPMNRMISHHPDEIGIRNNNAGRMLDSIILPKKVEGLVDEIRSWKDSKEWYKERNIPWKRGWLLYGPGGTGKTALARAFGEDLQLPVYVYNLGIMSNRQLMKAWKEMQANVPCIALIEDIDNVFHGRENVARTRSSGLMSLMMDRDNKDDNNKSDDSSELNIGGLTFDTLLNCLDGIERIDGVFTIITTNDISKVDPALGQPTDGRTDYIATRPGRIDKAIELTYMENEDKKRMAERILAGYEDLLSEICNYVDGNPDVKETPAQFQERCSQLALAKYWKEEKSKNSQLKLVEPDDSAEIKVA